MLGWILLGGIACGVTCLVAGLAAIRALKIEVNRGEAVCLGFALGSALVSTLTLGLALLFLARPGVFLGLALLAALAGWRLWPWFRSLKPAAWRNIPGSFLVLFLIAWTAYGGLYLLHALEPGIAADSYHLGFVNLWNQAHGMTRFVDCYAALPQGIEMLFLFAFSIGRHSSAALVHCWFLLLLPLTMVLYGLRFGVNRGAAAFGAIVVFATPMVGWDGSVAYNDDALAMAAFATLYLLQIWRRKRDAGSLVAAGLLAGYCVAIKYTGAFVLLPVAGCVLWELRSKYRAAARALLLVGLAAAAAPLPYLVRNWIWYRNPVAFFANSIFPNPYFSALFEHGYTQGLAHLNGVAWAELPRELTFGGPKLYYNLGPIYALAPIALAGLFWAEGRFLLVSALAVGCGYIWNKDPRFLIPMLPLVMMAVGFALSRLPRGALALWLLAAAQVALIWPAVAKHHHRIRPEWPSLADTDWRAALRLKPEEKYLRQFDEYRIARDIERYVPPGEPVLALTDGVATSYTTRFVIDSYHSTLSERASGMFYDNENSPRDYRWRWTAAWPSAAIGEVRIVQENGGAGQWSIGELRLLAGAARIPPSRDWRWEASANPWGLGLLSDGLEVTRWKSLAPIRQGMYAGVRLDQPRAIDGVEVALTNPPWESKMEAQALDGSGRLLFREAGQWHADAPLDLRKAVTQALKLEGIRYVLIHQNTYHGEALRRDAGAWGMRPLAETASAMLCQID